jgi:hypothetical protein
MWIRILATALGIGALAAAAQLGIAYGLGLVRFPRAFPADGLWATQLTWTAWFAMLAVLAGATGGVWTAGRLRRGTDRAAPLQLGQRIMIVLAAAVGAVVTVALTAVPARAAELAQTSPPLDAALAALLGVVAGILIAVAALSLRVVAVSVAAVVSATWLVALVSVVPSLGPGGDLPLVRLGVLDLPAFGTGARSTVAVLFPPALGLLVGAVVAAAARSRGLPGLHTFLAGFAGPALLALPYLIAPPTGGDRAVQAPAFGGALIAVAAGLLAGLVVAAARLPSDRLTAADLTGEPAGPVTGQVYTGMHTGLAGVKSAVPRPRYGPEQPPGAATAGSDQPGSGTPLPGTPLPGTPWPPPPGPAATDPAMVRPAPEPEPPGVEPPRISERPPAPVPVSPPPHSPDPVSPPPVAPPPVTPRVAAPPVTPPPVTPPQPPPPKMSPPGTAASAEPPTAAKAQPAAKKRPRHHKEEEQHLDWVRSLSGEDDEADPALGKRRLKRDADPDSDENEPGLPRPYAPPDSARR